MKEMFDLKIVLRLALLVALLALFGACGKEKTGLSLGTLTVNGTSIDGTIPSGTKRLYTLSGLQQGKNYTVSAWIPVSQITPTVIADGTFSISIYASESDFKNNPAGSILFTGAVSAYDPTLFETNFTPTSSGDYAVVVGGTGNRHPDTQFFYSLRITSADQAYLTSFSTPTIPATNTATINAGTLQIYSTGVGSAISAGTYSINLWSSVTATSAFPQMFVYGDASLTRSSLLYSSMTDTTGAFMIVTTFAPGAIVSQNTDTIQNNLANGVTIPNVSFAGSGPYIMINGMLSTSSTYSINIFP
jgi:hypothetical protein